MYESTPPGFPVTNTILQSEFSVKYSKFQGGIQEIHGHVRDLLITPEACKPKPSFSNCEPYRRSRNVGLNV